jgi:succinate dehydrogenase / fumarate reductase cytochrome b subunit
MTRPGVRRWLDPRGRHAGTWSFIAGRLAGVGLVGYLYLHLAVLSVLARGPASWDGFVALAGHPAFLALDAVLIVGLLVHAAHGIRVALQGAGLLAGARKGLLVTLAVAGSAVGVVAIALLFR